MDILPYTRKINYYETDRMGIVHHSNYIRYFEEARLDFMEQAGFDYAALENEGIISPVLSTSCRHREMLRYGDSMSIETHLVELGNVKYTFSYIIRDVSTNKIAAEGQTSHCFLNKDYKIISLKRVKPEIFAEMMKILEN